MGDAAPDGVVERGRVLAGLDDAVVLPQQLVARIAADLAELVVDVGDAARRVGDTDDGMVVQRQVLAFAFVQGGAQALLHRAILPRPPRPCGNGGDQVFGLHRLDQEVVAAQVQRQQLLAHVGLGGEEQDGQAQIFVAFAHNGGQLGAIDLGHVDVQY